MVPRPRNGLSLCAGGGGLDMGLMLAEPGFHTRCFVEWEEYPRSTLIAAQRAGYFAPAPIWDDVTTFDAKPFAGAFDTLMAGYPCQPFSQAGQRKGSDDERHLWPDIARIIGELGPGLEWVFLENVAGHVSLGLDTVLRDLWGLGFTPAAGLFSAGETGAPHERLRVFIVAHRNVIGDYGSGARRSGWRGEPADGSDHLADTSEPGSQGREWRGASDERDRSPAHGPVAELRRPLLHAPGPKEMDLWRFTLDLAPDLAPALSLGHVVGVADRAAQMVAQGRMEEAAAQSLVRRMVDVLSLRSRGLRLLGNGVHPLAAAHAWRTLSAAHGLRTVDLGAASGAGGASADRPIQYAGAPQ